MTEEVKSLAEENANLIFSFIRKHNISLNDCDDYYGLLAEAYMRACKSYKPEAGEFSTYAFKCMKNAYIRHGQHRLRDKRIVETFNNVSLDAEMSNDYEESNYNLLAHNTFENDLIDRLDTESMIKTICEVASSKQRDLIYYILDGLNGAEIGRKLNVSTQAINYRLQTIRKNLLKKGIIRND